MSNLDMFFRPKSIAIIGASNKPLTIPHRIITNLMDYGFKGPIYPVHPKEPFVKNLPAYKSIVDVPGAVDLAHIIVRRDLVPATIEECAKKGVKGVVVNTSGFSETGAEGKELEDRMRELGKKLGVRIFGPNCQGMMNTDPEVSLYSNFTYARIKPGHISILAQGGGLAEVLNSYISEIGIGIRMYASNGNACDVSIPEILAYWNDDPGTRVILLHVESFADTREFLQTVSAIKKPILALKSGTSAEGARAVASHTGRLMGDDTITDVLFDECGIVRFRTSQELCEAALAFASQPLPKGRRLGIVTNAGSPAIVAVDEGVVQGLQFPDPTPATQQKLREKLFATASVHNPVDMMATATPENWGTAVETVIEDGSYDLFTASFITPFFVDCEGVARELVKVHQKHADMPFLVCLMTNPLWDKTKRILEEGGLPTYYFPESASRVAAALARVGELKSRPAGTAPELKVDKAAATKIIDGAPAGFMPPERAVELLRAYGIPVAAERWCDDAGGLGAAAKTIGYPVVLKGHAAGMTHKTEAGAVAVGLADEAALRAAADRMAAKLGGGTVRWQLQEHLAGGTEVVLGAVEAGALGHLVMFGLGGIFVEALKDVRFGLAPLTDAKADRLIGGLKHGKVLQGFRGAPPVDAAKLRDLLLRVGRLVADYPRIAELDLNPVLAFADGARTRAVDVRIKLG
jgi:acyl-CoA synthetase (NDP forming)